MQIPQSYCSRCFSTKPSRQYEFKGSISAGNVKFSKSVNLPLCDECEQLVRSTDTMGRGIKVAFSIIGAILGYILVTAEIISGDPGAAAVVFGFLGFVIGVVLGMYILPRRRSTNFVEMLIHPINQRVTLKFQNEEYHKLYKSRNPLGHHE